MAGDYHLLSIDEIAKDPSFRNWILNPTPANDDYWNNYIELYPEQAGKISSAREIVLLTQMVEIPGLDEVRKMAMHDKLMQRIGRHKRNKTFRKILLWVAAVLIFVLMPLTILQLFSRWPGTPVLYETSFGQREVISLPDRSKVELNANSVLKVGDQWSTGIREVWL
ncbi:MAG: hypothetical protein KDC80_25025, partial [Saprospiraceae bacterium]|nr:hypothetical protein [Saprospiraceae bacterium]